jgi:glutamyl-tRNA synthetase
MLRATRLHSLEQRQVDTQCLRRTFTYGGVTVQHMLRYNVAPIRFALLRLFFRSTAAASAAAPSRASVARFSSATSLSSLECNTSSCNNDSNRAIIPVRTRFAPSPTGSLHLGGLRTALFCHVFARKHNGSFILRIEDTDQSRLVPGAADEISAALNWSGISPDEGPPPAASEGAFGPYTQSQRLPMYKRAAEDLVLHGHAYPCFCDAHRLDAAKAASLAKGLSYKYDRRCSFIPPHQAAARASAGEPHVIRLRAPLTGVTVVPDAVRGDVIFENSSLDDAVLLKSDGWPTCAAPRLSSQNDVDVVCRYHLACVVDDVHMRISHVIRGEEWLPSAPKHVIIYQAMKQPLPVFVHLPLLLNPDGSKLRRDYL